MAYNIDEQPITIGFARTPILYLVHDDNFAENSFQYIADVYLWQDPDIKPATPEYSLRKPANTSFGNAVFDIMTLTTDWLITPEFDIPNLGSTEFYVRAQIEFRYVYIDSGGAVVELPVGSGETTNEIIVTNGYNYYMDGLNYVPSSHMGFGYVSEYQQRVIEDGGTVEALRCIPAEIQGLTGSGFFMTNRPQEMCIPGSTSMYLFVYNQQASPVTQVVTEITTDAGTYKIFQDLISNTDEIVAIDAGSTEVTALFNSNWPEKIGVDIESWKIYGADIPGEQITWAYTFTICEPCKYGFKNLQFLNRYGVWDNLICYGTQKDSLSVKRSEILHSPLELVENTLTLRGQFNLLKPFGQFHMANIHGREKLTVNTGWINEEWNEVLKQFMITQYLYDADTLEPYTIEMKNINFKTSLNDGLSQYSIGLNKAFTAVGSVG